MLTGRLCLAVCLMTALVACGGSSDSGSGEVATEWTASEWPVYGADWTAGPGTTLGDDLVIPDNTYAIGPVMTYDIRRAGRANAWEARYRQIWMTSESDPYDLAMDFADQSVDPPRYRPEELVESTGKKDPPEFMPQEKLGKLCEQSGPNESENGYGYAPYTGELKPWAEHIECSASAWGVDGWVELRQDLSRDQPVVIVVTGKDLAAPESMPQVPEGVGGPGKIVGEYDLPTYDIVDGSFMAGPQGWGSNTGGFRAVIGVTGDPDEVFDAYLEQDEQEPYRTRDVSVDGIRVRQAATQEAGGVWMVYTLNETDGNAWILLEAYND